ncbi:MAG: vitamin K epoxide reductase family protein [Verrucomicrobiia bacterium]
MMKRLPYETTLPEVIRTFCRILIVLALTIDLYLVYAAISGDSVVGCGRDSDCDRVLNSKWSKLYGIPVSLLAVPIYIGLIYSAGLIRSHIEPKKQRFAWRLIFLCSVLILGAAIWFTILQLFIIKSICPYCMAAHILGGAASIILLIKAPIYHPSHRWERREKIYISPSRAKKRLIVAGALLAVLIVAQILYTPQTHSVKSITQPLTGATNTDIPADSKPTVLTNITVSTNSLISQTQAPANIQQKSTSVINQMFPPPKPIAQSQPVTSGDIFAINIAGARFEFNLKEVPVWGSTDAPCKILSLYDYTCHYCREMHKHLLSLLSTYSNKIGIINLPMPLDANCNPIVFRTPRAHIGSCEYAKLGLAVWRANRAAHAEYEKFLFDGAEPPPYEKAKAFAEKLVGSANLAAAMSDGWVTNMIKLTTSIFSTNALYLGQGQMPQVIIGTNLISGQIQNTSVLIDQIQKQYNILQ